jgi:hypothetical protein
LMWRRARSTVHAAVTVDVEIIYRLVTMLHIVRTREP